MLVYVLGTILFLRIASNNDDGHLREWKEGDETIARFLPCLLSSAPGNKLGQIGVFHVSIGVGVPLKCLAGYALRVAEGACPCAFGNVVSTV